MCNQTFHLIGRICKISLVDFQMGKSVDYVPSGSTLFDSFQLPTNGNKCFQVLVMLVAWLRTTKVETWFCAATAQPPAWSSAGLPKGWDVSGRSHSHLATITPEIYQTRTVLVLCPS
jgi:hypothetical protein